MRDDRGGAIPLLGLVVAFLSTAVLLVAAVGSVYAGRAQASLAADASALAAAVATYPAASVMSPSQAAMSVAKENGAGLTSCQCATDASIRVRRVLVEVTVPVQIPLLGAVAVRSRAAAEFDPRAWLGR